MSSGQDSSGWINATAPGVTPKITSIYDFSAEALGQLKLYIEQAGISISPTQILGAKPSRITVAQFRLISNPFDGQQVTITNIDSTLEWTFRYDGNAAVWKFQYGSPIFIRYDTAEGGAAASGVWTDYANGPSKTLDQKGSYLVEFGAHGNGNPAGTTADTGFSIAGAAPTFSVSHYYADNSNSSTSQAPVTITSNSTVVKLQHRDNDSTRRITVDSRWMKITPISISTS